jgi:hypothetical protein
VPEPREHEDDPEQPSMSGIKKFFIGLLVLQCAGHETSPQVVLGIIVCVVVGIMIYQNQQENSRKRFY